MYHNRRGQSILFQSNLLIILMVGILEINNYLDYKRIEPIKIKIDASNCTGTVAGLTNFKGKGPDIWYYKDIELEGGKIYGLISEYGQGCMYLSYLLGGNIELGELNVTINDNPIKQEELKSISWNLEPEKNYRNKRVKDYLEKTLKLNFINETYEALTDIFGLVKSADNLKFGNLSGERWRASTALGYALNKRIFYAPYECSMFYYQMEQRGLFKALRYLTEKGAIVFLPVGSDHYIKKYVDECIYLDKSFN